MTTTTTMTQNHTPPSPPSTFPPHIHAAFSGDMATTYSQRTGGCNILLANHLITLITPSLPPISKTQPLRILDNASGPLVLTTQLLQTPSILAHPNIHISAVDISADFIAANRALIESNPSWNVPTTFSKECLAAGPKIAVDTALMDSTALDQFAQDTFDLSLTSLALFAFPSPLAGIRELYRTLKPGGVTALTTWKRVDWIPLLHEVEELRNPGRPKTRVLSFMEEWSVDGKLEGMMREGGFERVEEGVLEGRALWGGCGEAAFWLAKTCEMMVGEGWGVGMEEGFRSVLERGVEEVKEGREGLVVVDGEGRVGVRMVAFVGVGWK